MKLRLISMKKKIGMAFISLSVIFTVFLLLNHKEISYKINVSNFEEIEVEDLENLSKNENTILLYIGRKTCPFCREFVPKLKSSASNNNNVESIMDSTLSEDEITDFMASFY